MAFKIAARTILHLGGELISSDAVALYELIKNAFDAGSKSGVVIDVTVRLKQWPGELWEQMEALLKGEGGSVSGFRDSLLADLDHAAPEADEWIERIREAKTPKKLADIALAANSITVRDSGHGMSDADLDQVYLTIGTRYRREERESQIKSNPRQLEKYPVLGEKGLGRLSAMRLGRQLHVETTKTGEANWNVLDIDWSRFSHDSDELLESIPIAPKTGAVKKESKTQGTKISISGLNSRWEKQDLVNFAKEQVCKFINPFVPERAFPISLRFNGDTVPIPEFDKYLLNNAQGYVSAEFVANDGAEELEARFVTHVEYRLRKKIKNFSLDTVQCLSASEAETPKALRSLGSFKMEAYWFNRQYLRSYVDGGIPIAKAVNEWSGGLMLFRDGFRVYPYGEKDDDWLLLDRKALASQGYKVNRKQLIGKVEISSARNPYLVDQTNREGLRDTPEKHAFVNLLKFALESQFRRFLREVDEEEPVQKAVNFEILRERMRKERVELKESIQFLKQRFPKIKEEPELLRQLEGTADEIEKTMDAVQTLGDKYDRDRTDLVHLAGLGLMAEFLAHELNRATHHALGTIADGKRSPRGISTEALQTLEQQLKTLQKRLSIMDPATTAGRQRKERFDLVALSGQIAAGHSEEFKRHRIQCEWRSEPLKAERVLVNMVKGMVVQVLENLIANSIYWLKQQQRLDADFEPHIWIVVDAKKLELRFTDDGPGVSEDIVQDLFKPFFSTKPPGEGKGLGLYISREIARYHGVDLKVSPEDRIHPDRFNTFVLTLPEG
jgi:signal transduction histidine kinase